MKVLLDEKEMRDLTPPESYLDKRYGYKDYNRQIEGAGKPWRDKHYRAAAVRGHFEIEIDERRGAFSRMSGLVPKRDVAMERIISGIPILLDNDLDHHNLQNEAFSKSTL